MPKYVVLQKLGDGFWKDLDTEWETAFLFPRGLYNALFVTLSAFLTVFADTMSLQMSAVLHLELGSN